ncbi:MAG TPA: STAS domain-containing protein [Candidatus Elarobacter sp.]
MSRSESVILSGDLDLFQAPTIRRLLDPIDGPATIDMRNVSYLDSSALKELARVARRVGPGQVTLVVASPNVRRVLDLVRFAELFSIVDVSRPLNGRLASA